MLRTTIRPLTYLQPTVQTGLRRTLPQSVRPFAVDKSYSTFGSCTPGRRGMWTASCFSWTGPTKTVVVMAATTSAMTASLWTKKPLHCQAVYTDISDVNTYKATDLKDAHASETLLHKKELSFGVVLGFCTGFLVKKVGKFFALMVGVAFLFMQYLSSKGYVTVNWKTMEHQYNQQLGVGQDGKGTTQALHSKWNEFVNFLTSNIQFKSTFLVGLYGGIHYG